MSGNDKSSSRDSGDSPQLTNWILDSGAKCHMTPRFSDLSQVHYKIRKNTLELRMDIKS